MTKDDIMKLALESGFAKILDEHASEYRDFTFELSQDHYPELERFIDLIAAHKAEVALAEAYRCGVEAGAAAESVGEVVEVNNDGFRCEFSQRLAVGTKLYTFPPAAQPVQEPVACRFCHSEKGCWTWQCYHCGEIDDVQQPAPLPVQEPVAYDKTEMNSFVIDLYDKKMQEGKHGHYEIMFHVVHQAIKRVTLPLPVQPEPLEYWNAVEGWVKIDEVREHFDAVNCGTIYKHGGEGRVPLYTAPPQRTWVGLTEFQFAEIYNKWNDSNGSTPWGLYHAIEKALKAKNHG